MRTQLPKGQRVFATRTTTLGNSTGAEIHFHLLHLRNDSAMSHLDGALPNFGQRHACLGFR
jgi:hypothetical protein